MVFILFFDLRLSSLKFVITSLLIIIEILKVSVDVIFIFSVLSSLIVSGSEGADGYNLLVG